MDSHIKERLVGATVLVALGVWLIPWLLDGQDAPESPVASEQSPVSLELPVPEIVPAETSLPPDVVEPDIQPPAAAGNEPAAAERTEVAALRPEPEPQSEPAPPAVDNSAPAIDELPAVGGWIVQIGSFREPGNALQTAGRVSDFGYRATVSDFASDSGTWHRVRVAGFGTRAEAAAASSALQAHGFDPTVLRAE